MKVWEMLPKGQDAARADIMTAGIGHEGVVATIRKERCFFGGKWECCKVTAACLTTCYPTHLIAAMQYCDATLLVESLFDGINHI